MVRLIGVTGGSGSGKSTVVKRIKKAHPDAVLIAQDNYYKSAPFINNSNITAFNFDHPDAFDMELMLSNLEDLKAGKPCMMPQYDFVTHSRLAMCLWENLAKANKGLAGFKALRRYTCRYPLHS